jgi:parvulin-like peptidyl-prolyl isomerase
VLLAVALTAVVLTACGSDPQPAATVNGTDITDAQLAKEAAKFSFLASLNGVPCGTQEGDETPQAACNRFTLGNMITSRLVADFAAANDVSVTDKEVADTIDQVETSVGKEALDAELKKATIGRAELDELVREILLLQAVQQEVVADRLGDEELRARYEQDILSYTAIQTDHILLKTEAEAQDVYRQVTAPGATEQDFLDLAKQVSIDPSAKENSGSLGTSVASQLVPEYANAAIALEPGEISQPVQSQFGWHVIRLVDEEVTPFEEVRDQIVQQEIPTVFDEWIGEQIGDEGVEVNPRYGRWDAKTRTVVRIDSTDPSATTSPSEPAPVNEG